ncbi:uncharacterized protein RCC_05592 [Ramularia collo-cygni]|uniref:Uncharacterized protein n=1 Tax=Ramularia collo-cygni TaxID=112498 RepID=A0A2D3V4W3_9PEZI|nr:uncharacterized protein RCC_05592 [Ramularia collo-cygni]CZT19737.1 uncharacterized protein RCC_05592 [Ramularia collo-cygni]
MTMLVPASFKYMDRPREKTRRRSAAPRSIPNNLANVAESAPAVSPPSSPPQRSTGPVQIPSPKSINARVSAIGSSESQDSNMRSPRSATLPTSIGRRKHVAHAHDPNALPPAIAALLAVTAIPPRKSNRHRRRGNDRRISIEELVSEWKSDDSLKQSYGSSAALSVLLEDTDYLFSKDCSHKTSYLTARSASSESMPSLASDDRSVMSVGSPSTPGSLRSRRSYSNLKKEKSRSLPAVEDCAQDHPLAPHSEDEDDELLLPTQKRTPATPKSSSFKSNITLSLQSLKKAAVSSISSLARSSAPPALHGHAAPHIDHMLWSHPFLFPRFSSEIRPAFDGDANEAQRRYLNPIPLTFEEWEAPFQQALHAPYLAEAVESAPTIQMQTYNRGRRRGGSKRGSPSPSSEAGRALLGPEIARRREVRENPDFLRVVVLEMNMRREGKLETGRAKICLPPRDVCPLPIRAGNIPSRWVGVSAY